MEGKGLPESPPRSFSQTSTVQEPNARARFFTTVLLVNNIHCASCVAYVKEVIAHLPHINRVDISIVKHEVRVSHTPELPGQDLVDALTDAAFEVFHASTLGEHGARFKDFDIDTSSWNAGSWLRPASRLSLAALDTRTRERNRRHLANCDSCRQEQEKPASPGKLSLSSVGTGLEEKQVCSHHFN